MIKRHSAGLCAREVMLLLQQPWGGLGGMRGTAWEAVTADNLAGRERKPSNLIWNLKAIQVGYMARCEKTLGGALLFLGDAPYNPGPQEHWTLLYIPPGAVVSGWGVYAEVIGNCNWWLVIHNFFSAHPFSCRCLCSEHWPSLTLLGFQL